MEKLAYSVPEAARLLGVHENTLWNNIQKGKIRVGRIGRRVLIPKQELERLLGLEPNKNPAGVGGER